MRLGATIDDYLNTGDPDALVNECRKKGYRAVAMPLAVLDQPAAVRDIASALDQADILLAEMAAWVNPLHHEPEQRSQNIALIERILTLADEVGAICCPTVVGSYCETDQWDSHVGHHPENFSERAFDEGERWYRVQTDDQGQTYRGVNLSKGIIDIPGILKNLWRHDYQGNILIEYQGEEDPREALEKKAQALLREAGFAN